MVAMLSASQSSTRVSGESANGDGGEELELDLEQSDPAQNRDGEDDGDGEDEDEDDGEDEDEDDGEEDDGEEDDKDGSSQADPARNRKRPANGQGSNGTPKRARLSFTDKGDGAMAKLVPFSLDKLQHAMNLPENPPVHKGKKKEGKTIECFRTLGAAKWFLANYASRRGFKFAQSVEAKPFFHVLQCADCSYSLRLDRPKENSRETQLFYVLIVKDRETHNHPLSPGRKDIKLPFGLFASRYEELKEDVEAEVRLRRERALERKWSSVADVDKVLPTTSSPAVISAVPASKRISNRVSSVLSHSTPTLSASQGSGVVPTKLSSVSIGTPTSVTTPVISSPTVAETRNKNFIEQAKLAGFEVISGTRLFLMSPFLGDMTSSHPCILFSPFFDLKDRAGFPLFCVFVLSVDFKGTANPLTAVFTDNNSFDKGHVTFVLQRVKKHANTPPLVAIHCSASADFTRVLGDIFPECQEVVSQGFLLNLCDSADSAYSTNVASLRSLFEKFIKTTDITEFVTTDFDLVARVNKDARLHFLGDYLMKKAQVCEFNLGNRLTFGFRGSQAILDVLFAIVRKYVDGKTLIADFKNFSGSIQVISPASVCTVAPSKLQDETKHILQSVLNEDAKMVFKPILEATDAASTDSSHCCKHFATFGFPCSVELNATKSSEVLAKIHKTWLQPSREPSEINGTIRRFGQRVLNDKFRRLSGNQISEEDLFNKTLEEEKLALNLSNGNLSVYANLIL